MPYSQLLDRTRPALARLEASLAARRKASRLVLHSANLRGSLTNLNHAIMQGRESLRLAIHSTNLLDSLANLNHAIIRERWQMDALDVIEPGLWAFEEFHSRVISWLLDPSAYHRKAGRFIAALLNATMAPPQMLDADWSASQVLQEWENVVDGQKGYLDILIMNRECRNLIAIENKTFSQEHSNQLTRYQCALANEYPNFTRHHIFLSPSGVSPYFEWDRKHWQPASYSIIHDAIREVLETGIADPDANALLQIYATTIRRNVMPDTNLDKQARRIYLEHREAIERIYANKPNWVNETKPMLKEAVAKHPYWRLDREDPQYVRFHPVEWDEFPSFRTGTGWLPQSNALLLFQFTLTNERPILDIGMSTGDPSNDEIRAALFDTIRQNPAIFKPTRDSLVQGWMILHMEPEYILESADYGPGWDDGSVRRKIEAWVDKFAAEQFPEMNRIIVDCLRRHQEA